MESVERRRLQKRRRVESVESRKYRDYKVEKCELQKSVDWCREIVKVKRYNVYGTRTTRGDDKIKGVFCISYTPPTTFFYTQVLNIVYFLTLYSYIVVTD